MVGNHVLRCMGTLMLAATVTVACAPGPANGTLSLSVSGLPDGVAAAVHVAGAGVALDLTAAGSVRLPAGTYTITVMPVVGAEAIAQTVYDGSAGAASVVVAVAETISVDISYARRPGTHRVWTSGGSGVHAFAPDAWDASGTVSPTSTLSLPPGWHDTQDIAFAPNGDLYTAAWTDGGIVRYTAADLDTHGAAPAGFVPVPGVSALAWHDGRLYAMRETSQALLRFDDPEAIVGDAVTVPDADIALTGYSGSGSSAGLAFDADGRLWMAFRQALVRLDDPTVPVGCTSATPNAVLALPTAAPRYALTYRDGALYTAPCGLGTIERFDGIDAATGVAAAVPTVANAVGMTCVVSIGMDASDRFWLGDARDVAGRFPDLDTLADGATVAPLVTIRHDLFLSAGSVAFHALGLGGP